MRLFYRITDTFRLSSEAADIVPLLSLLNYSGPISSEKQ